MNSRRNQNNYDPVRIAHDDVGTCIGAYQKCGWGTVKAIRDLAAKLRLAPRRIDTLHYLNQTLDVTREQQHWIARGVVRVLDALAEEHIRLAAECQRKAEMIRERQRQLELPLEEVREWRGSLVYSLRVAA